MTLIKGGEYQKYPKIEENIKTIYVPFCGNLSVVMYIMDNYENVETIHMSDPNKDLVNMYFCVCYKTEEFIESIKKFCIPQFDYYKCRRYYSDCKNMMIRSALFLILNRSCGHGTFFENLEGDRCLAPRGRHIVNWSKVIEEVVEISRYLKNKKVLIHAKDWKSLISDEENEAFYISNPNEEMKDKLNGKLLEI
mgnify:CR=1 FL=1|tara:strand:- start:1202 stop:1783 length:582 start_codon:yes stop_codon:yes gene_type:complete